MKQAHPRGRTAMEFFLSRQVAEGSFIAMPCRLVQAREDIVTVVDAADLLQVTPARVLELAAVPGFPARCRGRDGIRCGTARR